MTRSPVETYKQQMLSVLKGYPLWVPEPLGNLPEGVRIGDVGYVTTDGAFKTLFNICTARNDPANRFGVPEQYEQIQLDDEDIDYISDYHPPDVVIVSQSLKREGGGASVSQTMTQPVGGGLSIEYFSSSTEGAILHLPFGSTRMRCMKRKLRDQAKKHASNWYKFALECESEIPKDSLCLVTGIDRTLKWMVGTFSGCSSESKAALQVNAAVVAGGISYEYSWGNFLSPVYRIGPMMNANNVNTHRLRIDGARSGINAPLQCNQSICVHGYTIYLSDTIFRRILPKVKVKLIGE